MKFLTYCVTVMRDGNPPAADSADAAFEARAARLRELVQTGFAKLDAFRERQSPEAQDGIVNAAR